MRRYKRTVGDVMKIPLGDGTHVYARTLADASMAFYDSRTDQELACEQNIKNSVLIIMGVREQEAMKSGRWKHIGHAPLGPDLADPPPQFIQDPIIPTNFRLYYKGKMCPATREECEGLERCAVWEDPAQVEERLRDHYAGRPCKCVDTIDQMIDRLKTKRGGKL